MQQKFLLALSLVLSALAPGALAQSPEPLVVASTSWTAAIARAAGARNILVIAPFSLQHPAEYEIKPSDFEALGKADLVVHGGYEKFAKTLAESAGVANAKTMQLLTDNPPPVFKEQAAKVAEFLGTQDRYRAWAAKFDAQVEAMRMRVMSAYPRRKAVVHRFLAEQAKWWGFEVIGTFGPGELSPQALLALVQSKPDLVIDNWHNVSGTAAAEALRCPDIELINFPGKDGTVSIEDVFIYNEKALLKGAGH